MLIDSRLLTAVFLLTLTVVLAPTATADGGPTAAQPTDPSHTTPQGPSSPALALPPGAVKTLAELPAFEPGMWEFRRTVELGTHPGNHPDRLSKCSDPLNDIRQKMTEMSRKGCRIVGTSHLGSKFRSTWSCAYGDGVVSVSNVITAESATHYEDVNETRYGEKTTRTVVVATRTGDCPSTSK
jgi:hypothetical protein